MNRTVIRSNRADNFLRKKIKRKLSQKTGFIQKSTESSKGVASRGQNCGHSYTIRGVTLSYRSGLMLDLKVGLRMRHRLKKKTEKKSRLSA